VAAGSAAVLAAFIAAAVLFNQEAVDVSGLKSGSVVLPEPNLKGSVSVEEALSGRRSRREYRNEPLTLQELSQLLWSAQGVTAKGGKKTTPSAGATYPLEVYAVVGDVEGIEPGVYRYIPKGHGIEQTIKGDLRPELSERALSQSMITDAPVTLVFTAVYSRTTGRYGDRGIMYVHMEAGHAGQNVYLQAEALGLGTVAVGAFNPKAVAELLRLPEDEEPLYIFPVGRV